MERANPEFGRWLKGLAQRSGLRAFWRWWLSELATLMPAGMRTALRRRRLHPIVAVERDGSVLWAPRVANGALAFDAVGRIPLQGDPADLARDGHAAIEALPPANGDMSAERRVVIALPESQVLRKSIVLPAVVEENLHQTLAYDLDRHTPFKADEVYFDAIVVGRDAGRKEIRVDLAAALKSVVDQARRRVESWGAQVIAVTPEPPSSAAASAATTLNLLPPEERPETSRWRRWQTWVPLAAIALIALIVIALPIWQKRVYAISLLRLADQAKVQADASSALRDELERLTGDYNFALQRKYAFPAALQVVEDVTKLLPDDTWLTQFEMKTTARGKDARREIVLRGESANAGRLVSLLEDSKVFEQAAPRSPTTKIQPGPGEIFDLGAQLKTLPMPETLALAEIAPRPVAAPPAPASPGGTGSPSPPGKAEAPAPGAKADAPAPGAKGSEPASGGKATEPAAAAKAAAPAAPAKAAEPAPGAAARPVANTPVNAPSAAPAASADSEPPEPAETQ
jgi:general secretion pathway protein L